MKRDWLKGLGLMDDVIDKIMAENGNDIEKHKNASEAAKTEILAYSNVANHFLIAIETD